MKEEKLKKFMEETLPKGLVSLKYQSIFFSLLRPFLKTNLENILGKRGGNFFVGNKLSWTELHFLQMMDVILDNNAEVCKMIKILNLQHKNLQMLRFWIHFPCLKR